MSLFRAREWWSTTCGAGEEFDRACLCVANIDNDPSGKGARGLALLSVTHCAAAWREAAARSPASRARPTLLCTSTHAHARGFAAAAAPEAPASARLQVVRCAAISVFPGGGGAGSGGDSRAGVRAHSLTPAWPPPVPPVPGVHAPRNAAVAAPAARHQTAAPRRRLLPPPLPPLPAAPRPQSSW